MIPPLFACGSNASAQLSLGHADDAHTFQAVRYYPSLLAGTLDDAIILDLVSSSATSLLLVQPTRNGALQPKRVLRAGTNTLGQFGPRCGLFDGDPKPDNQFCAVDLLTTLNLSDDVWEPVKIAATWTTSFIVYQKMRRAESSASASAGTSAPRVEQMVLSCGSNDFAELGIALSDPASTVSSNTALDNPTTVELGLKPGEWVEHIKGGQRHVLVVISEGEGESRKQRLMGWGAARKGELSPNTPGMLYNGKTSTSRGKGKAPILPTTLPPVHLQPSIPPGQTIIDIALGASHCLVLLSNGDVLSWGSDAKGQITDVSNLHGIRQIAATWGSSYFLVEPHSGQQELWAQGANTHHQLLRKDESVHRARINLPEGWQVEKVVAGSEHLISHLSRSVDQEAREEAVWVGGWNEHGNLGLGDTTDRNELHRIDPISSGSSRGLEIKRIWGGCAATWVLMDGI